MVGCKIQEVFVDITKRVLHLGWEMMALRYVIRNRGGFIRFGADTVRRFADPIRR